MMPSRLPSVHGAREGESSLAPGFADSDPGAVDGVMGDLVLTLLLAVLMATLIGALLLVLWAMLLDSPSLVAAFPPVILMGADTGCPVWCPRRRRRTLGADQMQ